VRYHEVMRLLKQLAALVFWFFLWTAIPAALLYPFALWMAKRTQISGYALAQCYIIAISLLFLPTGFLIDFIYRHFVRDRARQQIAGCDRGPKLTHHQRFSRLDCRAIPDSALSFKFQDLRC
jgi:hypothetical protein